MSRSREALCRCLTSGVVQALLISSVGVCQGDARQWGPGGLILKVFISWSLEHSRQVAEVLHKWLPQICQRATPFMSSEDIEAGSTPYSRITDELADTSFGVLCVTRQNQHRQWLNFEAGALAKYVNNDTSRVVPLLVDLPTADLTGPLTMFQAVNADEAGIRKIALAMNNQLDEPMERLQVETSVNVFWPLIKADLDSIGTPPDEKLVIERSQPDMLGEILQTVRNLATLNADGFVRDGDRIAEFRRMVMEAYGNRYDIANVMGGPRHVTIRFRKAPTSRAIAHIGDLARRQELTAGFVVAQPHFDHETATLRQERIEEIQVEIAHQEAIETHGGE